MRLRLITLIGLMVALVPASADASKAGTTIKDCDVCPELVIVRAGNFMMGSNDFRPDEKPVRKVTIGAPLAVGKFEVTFAEWDACVADGGCSHKPGDEAGGVASGPSSTCLGPISLSSICRGCRGSPARRIAS